MNQEKITSSLHFYDMRWISYGEATTSVHETNNLQCKNYNDFTTTLKMLTPKPKCLKHRYLQEYLGMRMQAKQACQHGKKKEEEALLLKKEDFGND